MTDDEAREIGERVEKRDEYRLRKRKQSCKHEHAKFDGNYDWPGLVCAKCGKEVAEKDYED